MVLYIEFSTQKWCRKVRVESKEGSAIELWDALCISERYLHTNCRNHLPIFFSKLRSRGRGESTDICDITG